MEIEANNKATSEVEAAEEAKRLDGLKKIANLEMTINKEDSMWSRRKMSAAESVNMIAQMLHLDVVQHLDIFTCKYDSYRYIVNMI